MICAVLRTNEKLANAGRGSSGGAGSNGAGGGPGPSGPGGFVPSRTGSAPPQSSAAPSPAPATYQYQQQPSPVRVGLGVAVRVGRAKWLCQLLLFFASYDWSRAFISFSRASLA